MAIWTEVDDGSTVVKDLKVERQLTVGSLILEPDDGASLTLAATDRALVLNEVTTANRDKITKLAAAIFNIDTDRMEIFRSTGWRAAGGEDVTIENPAGVVYTKGSVAAENSWRQIIVPGPPDTFAIQRFEPLAEADIILDEAKIAAIEADPQWTTETIYFVKVATDDRINKSLPIELDGDQTGLFIEWNGFIWSKHGAERWVTKLLVEESAQTDALNTTWIRFSFADPSDHTRYPPFPSAGLIIGIRSTLPAGGDFAINEAVIVDSNGTRAAIVQMLHGPDLGTGAVPLWVDQLASVTADGQIKITPYYPQHFVSLDVPLGWIVCDQGVVYRSKLQHVVTATMLDPTERARWGKRVDIFDDDPTPDDFMLDIDLNLMFDTDLNPMYARLPL